MRHIAALCVALSCTVAAPVLAQPAADPVSSAREHYRKGTQLYDLQKYEEAAREYEAAYQAKEDPALLYNIGQSYRFAKMYDNAAGAFRSYLRRMPNPPNRVQVEALLVELTKLSEEQKRIADEQKRIADEQKRIADEQKRIADEQERLRVLAETEAKLRAAANPNPEVRHEVDLAAGARGRKMKWAGIGTAAAGGAALVAGVGLLGAAGAIGSRYNNLSTPTQFSSADESRFKTFKIAGAALAAVGAIAAVAGTTVAVLGWRKERRNRVALAPALSPSSAGLVVAGTW